MEIVDWEIMKCGIKDIIGKRYVLYGASSRGERFYMYLSRLKLSQNVIGVFDSDENKWGKAWLDFIICSSEQIEALGEDVLLIITSTYVEEIWGKLSKEYDQFRGKVISCAAFELALHYELMSQGEHCLTEDIVEEYRTKYRLWQGTAAKMENEYRIHKGYAEQCSMIAQSPEAILLNGIHKTGNTTLRASFAKQNNVVCSYHRSFYDEQSFRNMKELLCAFKDTKVKIISGIREPVERIISAQWQIMKWPYLYQDRCIDTFVDENYFGNWDQLTFEERVKRDADQSAMMSGYNDVRIWFDDHVKRVYDIDIFEVPFDREKGYSIVTKGNVSVFVYRLDMLNHLERELAEFCGLDDFRLCNSNLASEKAYSVAYKQYLKEVRIEKGFFDRLVNSCGMTHFYTPEEIRVYCEKWRAKLGEENSGGNIPKGGLNHAL